MTVSTHTYLLRVRDPEAVAYTEYTLPIIDGRLKFDSGRAPHCTLEVEVTLPPEMPLHLVDPRGDVGIDRQLQFDFISPTHDSRQGWMSLRGIDFDETTRLAKLRLESGEGSLGDYAKTVDDITPYSHASSLRDVCSYVLGEALGTNLIGGSIWLDADVTPRWAAQNMCTNPSAEVDLTGWTVVFWGGGSGAGTLTRVTGGSVDGTARVRWAFTGAPSGQARLQIGGAFRSAQGNVHRVTARVRANNAAAVGQPLCLSARVAPTADGSGSTTFVGDGPGVALTTSWQTITIEFTVPAGAWQSALVELRSIVSPIASGAQIDVDMVTVVDGPVPAVVAPSFNGASSDAYYTYAWDGTPHQSTSRRVPHIERPLDSLRWRAGQSALAFLGPLVQAARMRLVCDEQNTWTLRDEDYVAGYPGSPDMPMPPLEVAYGVDVIDGGGEIDRDTGEWFDAALARFQWTDAAGVQQVRTDAYALPGYTKLQLFEYDTPYPGPGFARYAVERASYRGRVVRVTTVARWFTAPEQPIEIIGGLYGTETGEIQSVEFDLSTDRMTVIARIE